jgi:hypothetical protein
LAYNGSGTFVRVHDWTTDLANTVPVTASRMDDEMDGMATGLSTAICKDGQTTATARIPFASGASATGAAASGAAYANTNDANTGLYFPAADQWGLTAGGTGTLTSTATALTGGSGITLTISGLLTISSGGYTVTGNSTVTGTLGVSSDFAVATNKFTVAAASGNTVVAGTLGVTGDVAVNTNKFNVTASSGNTTVAGTLGVTGATSLAAVTATTIGGTNITGSGAISGTTVTGDMMATSAEQVTGSATDQIVSPGVQHFHTSAIKAWAKFDGTDASVEASYNITGVSRGSTGDYTVTIANDFSDEHYVVLMTAKDAGDILLRVLSQAAGSFTIKSVRRSDGADSDPEHIYFACIGTLA